MEFLGTTVYQLKIDERFRQASVNAIINSISHANRIPSFQIANVRKGSEFIEYEVLSDEILKEGMKDSQVVKPFEEFKSFEIIILGEDQAMIQGILESNGIKCQTTSNET